MNALSKLLLPALLLLSFHSIGCAKIWKTAASAPEPHYLRQVLLNVGPVLLSKDNPYVDPNRFLSVEASKSETLSGFLKHRGEPNAIELRSRRDSSLLLTFYYKEPSEMFRLGEMGDQWSIRGPFRVDSPKALALLGKTPRQKQEERLKAQTAQTSSAERATPVAALPIPTATKEAVSPEVERTKEVKKRINDAERIRKKAEIERISAKSSSLSEKNIDGVQGDSPKQEQVNKIAPFPKAHTPLQGTLPPSAKPTKTKASSTLSSLENTPAEKVAPAKPKQKEEPVLKISDGDVEHTVVYSGETLRLISRWYTGTAENAKRIARINKLRNANRLRLKQVIRIPEYLVVRLEPFPKSEVDDYLKR